MAIVTYGTDGVEISKVGTDGGSKTTLVNSGGKEIYKNFSGLYDLPIQIIPTTVTANTYYFTLRNTGATTFELLELEVQATFAGTAAATRSIFGMGRFSTATPTGGTAITAIKMDTVMPAITYDARFAPAGLTVTGVVAETNVSQMQIISQLTATYAGEIVNASIQEFTLAPGEGFYIRAETANVAGAAFVGVLLFGSR